MMLEFIRRILMVPTFLRGDIVAIRVGRGVGITVYKGSMSDSTIRRIATQFFKQVHKI